MPDITPTFQDLTPSVGSYFDVGQWYTTYLSPGIPDTVAPYLAAHGYQIAGGNPYEIDGDFAGFLLNMYRNSFSHAEATQLMLNAMVFAYNEGRTLNDRRYEDLLANHQTLLANHQEDIGNFITNNITDATSGYVTVLISSLDQLDTDHSSFESDVYGYDTGDRAAELSRLKTVWQDAATTLESEYDTITNGLDIPGLIAEVGVSIDALDDALTRFTDRHDNLGATLLTDFESHETTATAFLTDLGVTELARINEEYDNKEIGINQGLVNRGFYSSALPAQVAVQIARERSERITQLNDQLNREKFENQHRLYDQKYRMRLGSLEADYKVLQGASAVLQARLQHAQWASRIRHEVAQLSIDAKLRLLSVRERYYQFLLQSIDWQTDRRMKIYDALFRTRIESMRIRQSTGAFHADIIRHQVDSRNQLALAMFGLVERREDSYPDIGDMTALVTSLGDDE